MNKFKELLLQSDLNIKTPEEAEKRIEEITKILTEIFNKDNFKIENIELLKSGMTNRSFLFTVNKKRYILRIPGPGTENFINRKQEKEVYDTISPLNLSDNVIFFDECKGYKITEFLENSHNLDPYNEDELKKAMQILKQLHQKQLKIGHYFDLFEKIEYYESLMKKTSIYKDYTTVKNHILKLKKVIEAYQPQYCLCHIDSVHDNFILNKDKIVLIDFEYAAMQDPDSDLAMFCVYAMYKRKEVDKLIELYYNERCAIKTKYKIYAYIAISGLLWSNWCEYKVALGNNLGTYAAAQYQFAKEYYNILLSETSDIPEFASLRNEK